MRDVEVAVDFRMGRLLANALVAPAHLAAEALEPCLVTCLILGGHLAVRTAYCDLLLPAVAVQASSAARDGPFKVGARQTEPQM